MVRHTLVLLAVESEHLLFLLLERTEELIAAIIAYKETLENKKILPVPDAEGIGVVEKTLGKREVMNGIKDVGLPYSVVTHKAVEPR